MLLFYYKSQQLRYKSNVLNNFNPLHTNVSILCPPENVENHRFHDAFWGYKNLILARNGSKLAIIL